MTTSMHGARLIAVTGLCAALTGCGTEPPVCTAVFEAIAATVVNGAAQPLNGLTVTDTVRRTGAVLQVSAGSVADTLPANSIGRVVIFSDAFLQAVLPTGDEVIVVAAAGGRHISGPYRFGSDGCHVQKLAGADTLVVP
jgi:hypothetical protein